MKNADVIVIGAGVIGISAALELQRRGNSVLVLDRDDVAAQASAGNAGAFAFAEVEPLATPGVMFKAPKWLLDPLGPLSVPPAYALQITPWMLRFWRASWRDRYVCSITAQSQLMKLSKSALERQIAQVDGEHLMRRDGQLQLYEVQHEFDTSLGAWDLRRKHGIAFTLLENRDAIAEIQPGLDPRFTHAGFTPDWMNTVDPKTWVAHLARAFQDRGGRIERQEIRALSGEGDGARVLLADGSVVARRVIVAAGAWSHHLARTLGDHIPLETERGYNTTLPAGAFDLRTHLTFCSHGFVVTRINGGVRVGGAVELGGLKRPPNFKRADTLLRKAAQFLPGLNTDGGTQWMGFRPSLPDSLPVIGVSPKSGNIIYAFGHGHLGLTQAAGTAELVAAIVDGGETAISVEPYSAIRF